MSFAHHMALVAQNLPSLFTTETLLDNAYAPSPQGFAVLRGSILSYRLALI